VEGSEGETSLGSGFVVDPTGTLVTNVHVLAGAQRATATFPNGTACEIRGTLLFDEARDICIAQLEGQDFPVLKIATALPRKGERITALGSPQGLSFSATTGIVSAIRPAEELGPEIGRPNIKGVWIQVDAALSGGNSGGPLISDLGEVVAMSTLASQGSAQNLNFGISAADILQLQESARGQASVALPEGVGKLESSHKAHPKPDTHPSECTLPSVIFCSPFRVSSSVLLSAVARNFFCWCDNPLSSVFCSTLFSRPRRALVCGESNHPRSGAARKPALKEKLSQGVGRCRPFLAVTTFWTTRSPPTMFGPAACSELGSAARIHIPNRISITAAIGARVCSCIRRPCSLSIWATTASCNTLAGY
jgi:hypothetical protein